MEKNVDTISKDLLKIAQSLVAKDEWVLHYEAWIDSCKDQTESHQISEALEEDKKLDEKDKKALIKRLNGKGFKTAKSLTAGSLLDSVLSDREVATLDRFVDEQTYELAVEVFSKLRRDLELSDNQTEAINRLKQSVQRGSGMDEATHRNNIFKAAHALGIKLPSSMF